jgi:hypothetical protein
VHEDSIGNSFSDLTLADLDALTDSDNIDDNQLAARLERRQIIEGKLARGEALTEREAGEDMEGLRLVTDNGLSWLAANPAHLAALKGGAR